MNGEIEAIFSSLNNHFIIYDANGRIAKISEAAKLSLGSGAYAKLSSYKIFKDIASSALKGGIIRETSVAFCNQLGIQRSAVVSASPIRGKDGISGAVLVWHDITERKKIEESLRSSQRRHSLLKANTPIAIIDLNPFSQITDWNPGARNIFHYNEEEVLGKNLWELVLHGKEKWLETTKASIHAIRRSLNKEGREIICEWFITKLIDERSNHVGTTCIAKDITREKEAELKLQRSLEEKEMLLKEVHHRVKNNLQIISSLLNLQLGRTCDKQFQKELDESMSRIKSMALIHEMLYKSGDYTRVNFSNYLNELIIDLGRLYGSPQVSIKIDSDEIYLPINQAISAGLLVNELATNCLKHAFPHNRKGEIKISLRLSNNKYHLLVMDNGIGLGKIRISSAKTLGLQLATTLAKQLGGKLSRHEGSGTMLKVIFSKEEGKNESVSFDS